MGKMKMIMVLGLVAMLSGCFGGGVRSTDKHFIADGGTFNFFLMHINYDGAFDTNADAMKVAQGNIPSGGKTTNVGACPTPWSQPFPMCIFSWLGDNIMGATYCQIGGTK